MPPSMTASDFAVATGHACPASREGVLGEWLKTLRRCYDKGTLAASKIAALKAVGVEFDGVKALQHKRSGSSTR